MDDPVTQAKLEAIWNSVEAVRKALLERAAAVPDGPAPPKDPNARDKALMAHMASEIGRLTAELQDAMRLLERERADRAKTESELRYELDQKEKAVKQLERALEAAGAA